MVQAARLSKHIRGDSFTLFHTVSTLRKSSAETWWLQQYRIFCDSNLDSRESQKNRRKHTHLPTSIWELGQDKNVNSQCLSIQDSEEGQENRLRRILQTLSDKAIRERSIDLATDCSFSLFAKYLFFFVATGENFVLLTTFHRLFARRSNIDGYSTAHQLLVSQSIAAKKVLRWSTTGVQRTLCFFSWSAITSGQPDVGNSSLHWHGRHLFLKVD